MKFLLRRTTQAILQLLCVSFLTFALFSVVPGDFFTELNETAGTSDSVQAMRKSLGLNRPWPARYTYWLGAAVSGDFGESIAYRLPVRRLVSGRIANTLRIAAPAYVLAWLLGIAGALVAARWDFARSLDLGAGAAAMVPDVIAISLLLWISVWIGLSITGVWLPVAGLTCSLVPVVFLHASGELRAAQNLEFVKVAKSRGLRGSSLWLRFIVPAAANPLISLGVLSVAATIASSFVVEVLTGWPGLGALFLEAVQSRDFPIVQAVIMLLAAVLCASNLAGDIAIYHLDPRIRVPYET